MNLQQLVTDTAASKVLTPEDKASLGAMRDGMRTGNVPVMDPKVLAKAEAVGALKPAEIKAYRDQANATFLERLKSIPEMSFGKPFVSNPDNMRMDNTLTGRVANELMTGPMTAAGSQHMSYAASLTTLGEGVKLSRYSDPAAGAGDNIGMGYNLKANAATANEDLRRAGVPADVVQQVLDGKAELTTDQAKRLLMVSLPRYEKSARDTAEATSPGLWAKMLPQQKAVMIDVAYQVGSTDQFKKAWGALARGDATAFADATKVTYVDKSGTRKEDTRRNGLRATMLGGLGMWDQAMSKYAALPSTKLAANTLTK